MVSTDFRMAVRALRQAPAFTLTAVLSLALGIGAATSVYVLTSTLFSAPPAGVDQPDSLVRLCRVVNGRPEGHELSYAEYVYYRDHASVFADLASDGNVKMLTDTEAGSQLLTAVVSSSYFGVLGLRPRVGRFFLPAEDTAASHDDVVVLSYGFWQKRFAGEDRSIGERLTLGGTSYTIVGVAPPDFEGSSAGWAPDVFVPTGAVFTEADFINKKNGQLDLIGRLKPGRTVAEAQAEITVLTRQLEQTDPETIGGTSLLVSKLRGVDPEARSSNARLPAVLVATVACLLLIACVHLAGLLQTRHAARGKEMAIRLALGAGRGRLIRQLLTESLLLSALGGAAGLFVGWWATTMLERAYAREMFDGARHFYFLTFDARAVLLTVLMASVTGMVFGLAPAWQASRPALVPALKEDASAPGRARLRAAFLAGQVALSLLLLVGAVLTMRSLRTVRQNPGFDAAHVAYFNVTPARAGYRGAKATRYAADVRRRLETLPFVESMSAAWVPPPFWFSTADVFLPSRNPVRPEDTFKVPVNWVSARFFETLRIPLRYGRGIEQPDIDQGRSLVVVNEALARRLWTEPAPVGRTLMMDGKPFEVAGIVRYQGLREGGETSRPYLFGADDGRRQQGSLLVRVKGDAAAALPTLRREILAADANVPINQAMSLISVIANQEADVPIAMGVLTFAGALALLLTVLGLYGVVAQGVAQRTREIGIRLALGARAADIVTLVLREGLRFVVIGVTLGLAAALGAVRFLSSYLYGVSATDPATFVATTAFLAGVALFACYIPARRAIRVDPVQVLRRD
jgi:putative ABC transport system permease protein